MSQICQEKHWCFLQQSGMGSQYQSIAFLNAMCWLKLPLELEVVRGYWAEEGDETELCSSTAKEKTIF